MENTIEKIKKDKDMHELIVVAVWSFLGVLLATIWGHFFWKIFDFVYKISAVLGIFWELFSAIFLTVVSIFTWYIALKILNK